MLTGRRVFGSVRDSTTDWVIRTTSTAGTLSSLPASAALSSVRPDFWNAYSFAIAWMSDRLTRL